MIDDDASLRRVTEFNLDKEGYRVLTAANGAEGIALFKRYRPALVITDVKMPDRVLSSPEDGYSLEDLVKEAVEEALRRCNGTKSNVAAFLKIPRHILQYRIEKYDIRSF